MFPLPYPPADGPGGSSRLPCPVKSTLRPVRSNRAAPSASSKALIWLVTVEGQEPAVAAESLGITAQAVYGAIYRVRRRIRQELDGLVD